MGHHRAVWQRAAFCSRLWPLSVTFSLENITRCTVPPLPLFSQLPHLPLSTSMVITSHYTAIAVRSYFIPCAAWWKSVQRWTSGWCHRGGASGFLPALHTVCALLAVFRPERCM